MSKQFSDDGQIVRTTEGIEKRKPLEEARVPDLQRVTAEKASHFQRRSNGKPEIADHQILKPKLPIISIHSNSIESMRYINFAYETYLNTPDGRNKYTHMPVASFLNALLAEASPDTALDSVKLAIAIRMCSLFHGEARLLPEATKLYTNALRALQRNLESTDTAMKDETLAGSCLMALYEVNHTRNCAARATIDEKQWTDPEQTDPSAWLGHMAGLATLLQARGPYRQYRMLARVSFENCRYNLVSFC